MSNYRSAACFTSCPWLVPGFSYGHGVFALHREIEHFFYYMQPTHIECSMRYEAIKRIQDVIVSIWPDASVEVYGSFRAGMYLPSSDIDLAIYGPWPAVPLCVLESELIIRNIAVVNSIVLLDKASVPVLKFIDRLTHLKFDISCNVEVSVQAAEYLKELRWRYPQMPKLVMVIKQFLVQVKLNEVYSGGVSSYAVTLMCIAYLQSCTSSVRKPSNNIGVLLLKMLEFYGRKFDYSKFGISIRSGKGYVPKEELLSNNGQQWLSMLSIEDPLMPTNDIGRSSYGITFVKEAFENAYIKLSKVVDSNATNSEGSLLNCILSVSEETINYREWVNFRFRYLDTECYVPINPTTKTQKPSHFNHQTVVPLTENNHPNYNKSNAGHYVVYKYSKHGWIAEPLRI